jgi:hypothetical protein
VRKDETQHWRGFPAIFAPKAAPILEFDSSLGMNP